jgi:type IV fimbrial biogenesis protein FimT
MDVVQAPPRRSRGFSLIELITTLTVAGVSLAILLPSWSGLSGRSQITATANQLLNHLRYARNEAVTRNTSVGLCPSADGASCSGNPRGWQDGFLVFVDADRNRSRSADEPLLRVQQPQRTGLRLFSTSGRPAVVFRGDGAAWGSNTTFSVCLGDEQAARRAVVLYGSGRARVDRRGPGNRPVNCT